MSYRPDQINSASWRALRPMIARRAGFRCENPKCRKFLGMTGHVDHIVPRAECESIGIHIYDPTNCQYLCAACHSSKSNLERRGRRSNPTERNAKETLRRVKVKGRDEFLRAAGISTNDERSSNVEVARNPACPEQAP